MGAITICSYFGAPKIKSNTVSTVSTVSPSIFHEVMGPDAMIFVFWMLSFKPAFHCPLSLSSRGSLVLLHLMVTHSSILAWRIPGMGEPGGLPSMGSHRVGHDWSNLAAAAARLVIAFLLRSKHLLISWLESPSAVILEPPQNKVCHCFHCFPSIHGKQMGKQ